MCNVIVCVPIYKKILYSLDAYSLDVSLAALHGRDIRFICPKGLDMSYYFDRYGKIIVVEFGCESFASIAGYNRLLLSPSFYEHFAEYEFMMILQTDAIVLRDELAMWCVQPFDYVGAPWPDGLELFVNLGTFQGDKGRRVRATVGNGGLSLRRIKKCIAILREFPDAIEYFQRSGSSEDLFFSFMGNLSLDFVMPNEITASRFSLELKPSFYYAINGEHLPMGGHAWWKYEMDFWRKVLPPSVALDSLLMCCTESAVKVP